MTVPEHRVEERLGERVNASFLLCDSEVKFLYTVSKLWKFTTLYHQTTRGIKPRGNPALCCSMRQIFTSTCPSPPQEINRPPQAYLLQQGAERKNRTASALTPDRPGS